MKLSRSLQELSARARVLCEEYRTAHDREIKISELAENLGVDVYKASLALNASQSVLSLSGGEEDDMIDVPVPSVEENLTEKLSLRQAISTLDQRDRELIDLRYYRHQTQQQTAEKLGTTQVQISRREKKILLKMRAMLI